MRDINGKASKRETAVERNRAPIANLGRDLRRQYEDGAADDLVDADRGEVPLAKFAPQLDVWNGGGGWRNRCVRHEHPKLLPPQLNRYEPRGSLRLDVICSDHLGPLFGFICDELAEVGEPVNTVPPRSARRALNILIAE
jgi:hypothetical protein